MISTDLFNAFSSVDVFSDYNGLASLSFFDGATLSSLADSAMTADKSASSSFNPADMHYIKVLSSGPGTIGFFSGPLSKPFNSLLSSDRLRSTSLGLS